MIANNKANANSRSSSDSSLIIYIPFVRDSQNYVNAAMIISAEPGDTSFRYLCDWQYANQQFSTTAITDTTAEKMALLFMVLDRNTLGHQEFTIRDKRLFHGSTNYADTANIERKIKIEPVQTSGRSSLMASICYTTSVWTVTANWHCTHSGQCASGVCDECPLCVDYTMTQHTEVHCFDEEIGDPTTGGGTGSGGSSGNSTPMQCTGTPAARTENVTNPCEPGWEPGPTYSTEDPCIKLSPFTTDSYFKNAFTDLKNKANPNVPNPENREYVYKYQSDGIMVGPVAGEPNKCEIEQKTMYMLPVKAYMHSHYPGCPEPIFSPGDIQLAFDLFKTSKVVYPFVFAVATAQGNYVMVINDPTAFDNFGSKYFLEDSPKDPGDLARVFKTYKLSLSNPSALNEKLFLDFLKEQNVTGIELLKANGDFTQYNKLTLKRDGQLFVIPCN